jgi:hypothetical protein
MMTRTEPNSSFSGIQTNGEIELKLLQPLDRAGNVKFWADPRSSWMTNLGFSEFTDEEGNAISNLITEQVDSVTE